MLPPPTLFNPEQHAHLLPRFAEVHIACVQSDHTLATFLPPFNSDCDSTDSRVLKYWEGKATQAAAGDRVIIMQMISPEGGLADVLAGFVMLAMPGAETGPFRGSVEKLLVDPRFRRMGVAKQLMHKLEEVAIAQRRHLLVLDTEVGSPAEAVYPRLGYTAVGTIPRYGISPKDGRLVDEIWFYKDLRSHAS
ncbi:hypothetical protein AAFC00_001130 [Neodothiora populina]|uniref:N-acetyltransferase domain-containing protein n=2 Tax=Neodothiora populina TaxID=2781224 RepID=A0ABR3PN65_9PEZI